MARWCCRLREKSSSRHVFTNFPNNKSTNFFYQMSFDIFFLYFLKCPKLKKRVFWLSFSTEKYWVKKFVDSYSENSWKHVVISIKGQVGAYNMFDHINLFSELSPENHPVAIYNGEAPLKAFDAKNVIACGLLGRL